MSTQLAAKTSVYAALASNLAIAIVKFAAAAVTGSSAMLSEGVHSLVDTTNELLVLYGIKRAARLPTRTIRWDTVASSTSGASSWRFRCSWSVPRSRAIRASSTCCIPSRFVTRS